MAEPDPMVQIETAIMVALGATVSAVSTDPQLAAAAPGGVHSRTAPAGVFPYITVRLTRQDTDYTFRGPWRHRFKYNIQAVDQSSAVDAASAALERVYDLLQDQDAVMLMEDFYCIFSRRKGRTSLSPKQQGTEYQQITDEWDIQVVPK